ncbi:UNVERIFIED_CONTAM: hypothetical protein GTU68_040608, partial [Idotea baltica]|nr:hypothetical protein [Idotea baltica]
FEGKTVLVTGGSRGIGKEICRSFAEQGAHVVINFSRSAASAEELAKELDSTSGKAVDAAVKAITAERGAIDVLVNNAGIAEDGLLVRTKAADWQRTIDVNLSGSFYCAKAVAKGMMKARSGRIVSISSVIGETGNAGQVAYAASKSGVFGLTKSLAKELGSRGITANAVTPGFIATEMTDGMSEEQTQGILSNVTLGRLGTTKDVSELVLFLASDRASYITGQVIGVNGGLRM